MASKTSTDFSFDSCFAIVVGHEGIYSNDPRDPGGETKYGVSKRAYPDLDIKNMTLAEAKNIYLNDYWVRLNRHDPQLNLMAFDCAINQGLSYANSLIAQTSKMETIQEKLQYFRADRAMRYRSNKNFEIYGRGWIARLDNINDISWDNLTV